MGRTGWVVVAGVSSGLAGRSEALMRIDRLDHLVLTVADVGRTVEFYERVLGMQAVTFGGGRRALRFGTAKVNLHQAGQEFEPKAAWPVPGGAAGVHTRRWHRLRRRRPRSRRMRAISRKLRKTTEYWRTSTSQ
jgi:Glyoxalase/Bleomycin resistance protein/Dioxygenase superfamily